MNSYEKIMDNIANTRKMKMEGQLSLFDISSDSSTVPEVEISYPDLAEYDSRLLLSMEKDVLGLYISGHPLSEFEEDIKISNILFFRFIR